MNPLQFQKMNGRLPLALAWIVLSVFHMPGGEGSLLLSLLHRRSDGA